MVETIIEFDKPKMSPSIIMVTGVGGGGSNAVNHMYELGIADVSFMVCNTDQQALMNSPVPIKVRLGENLTQGLGAGNNPERGRAAALESIDEITEIYKREGTKMVFITAGMGGGTGTGAAPIIAKAARELGILTVAIVTLPFKTEGPKRMAHAAMGVDELKQNVDSLILINNENIQEIYGKLTLSQAFGKADDILATAAKGIAELITRENTVNVDFADVQSVMHDSGIALMGSSRAAGEDRAREVADAALSSPLLNHNDITGATNILINITSGSEEITLEETYYITEYIQERAGNNADIIWGAGSDEALGDEIEVTIIATGFDLASMPQLFGNSKARRSPLQESLEAAARAAVPDENGDDGEQEAPVDPEEGCEQEPETEPEPAPQPEVVPPRRRFVPPVSEPEPPRPPVRRPVSDRVPSASTYNPLGGMPVAQSHVLEPKKNDPDINIDELENVPAFKRRQMKFIENSSGESGRNSRVVLRDDAPQDERKSSSSSLFDDM